MKSLEKFTRPAKTR